MKALVVTSKVRADRLVRPLEAVGVEVVCAHPPRGGPRGRIAWAYDVLRLGHTGGADVIFSHEPGPICTLLAMLGRQTGRPVLVRWRGDPWQEYDDLRAQGLTNPLKMAMGHASLQVSVEMADMIVPVSRSLAESIAQHTGCPEHKLAPIPIGIDIERFRPVADREALKAELGYPGQRVVSLALIFQYLQKNAGLERFLPALRALVDARDDVTVVIAGSGRLQEDFERRHRRLLDHPRMVRPGWIEDLQPLLQASDIFCHFSYFDACPNVIFEAWACGTPVIVNDYAPLLENLTDGDTGHVFAEDASVDECVAIFERLLLDGDHWRAVSDHGRRLAQERFSYQAIGRRLLEVSRRALDGA